MLPENPVAERIEGDKRSALVHFGRVDANNGQAQWFSKLRESASNYFSTLFIPIEILFRYPKLLF